MRGLPVWLEGMRMPTRYRGTPAEAAALDAYIKLMRCASAVQEPLDRRLDQAGLTENQFGVLDILYHLGPTHQRELGGKLFTTGANISVIVDNLEKRGLVTRVRRTGDRRFIEVHLTEAGKARFKETFPGHVERIAQIFGALSPEELATFSTLCRKLGQGQATTR